MNMRTIIKYLLAVIIVLILGSLAGWYFFLRAQTETITAQSTARGFGAAIPEGNADGTVSSFSPNTNTPVASAQTPSTDPAASKGFFSRIWSMVTGTGDNATAPSGIPSFGDRSSPFSAIGGTAPPSPQTAQPIPRPPQLWHIGEQPVAGQLFVGTSTSLRLRYVERASGHVFEADPETGKIIRLTNTLLPKIYEALLTENGHVFERSLDAGGNITTFAGNISSTVGTSSATSSAQALNGSYLEKNIASLSVDRRSGALFYVVRTPEGTAGVTADWNGTKQKTIFSSVLMSWLPSILADGRIILVQAAADGVPGYAYELKRDGALIPLLGPVSGLTVRVRPAGGSASSAILWGQSARGIMNLFVQVGQGSAVQLPIRTIADKCAWSPGKDLIVYCGVPQGTPGQNFLDNWYRGATHSSDALWRIDASAGTAEMAYAPPSNVSLDIEQIEVDGAGNYITFTNAADKSLWLLRLTK